MPVDLGAAILQAAQVITSNAARKRQLDMQEQELQMRAAQIQRTTAMEDRRLRAQEQAQQAEQQFAQVRARLQDTEARLNLLKLGETERENAASARYNDPSILDDAERASAQKYAGFATVKSLQERVSELTKANTQLPPSDPAYVKNQSDVADALREIQYRGRYIGNAVGAAFTKGDVENPEVRSAQRQAGEAIGFVNEAVGAPKPGTPPAGTVGTVGVDVRPIGDLVVDGKKVLDAYRAGQLPRAQALTEMEKILRQTAPHRAGPYWNANKPLFMGMLNELRQ